jgi:predicted cupin superfamily sugar epimerase
MYSIDPQKIIALWGLEPLPEEGGYYKVSYLAGESIPTDALPNRYRGERPFSTAIYYLLTSEPDSFSALHLLQSDEIWHFYLGDRVELLLLHPDGSGEVKILGQNIFAGELVQVTVPKNTWMGACLVTGGTFALMGTTMAPGFSPDDFELGRREHLIAQYPEFESLITRLTRENSPGQHGGQ